MNSTTLSPPAAVLAGWGRELTTTIAPHRLADTLFMNSTDTSPSSSSSSSTAFPSTTASLHNNNNEPFWMSTGVWVHELIDSSLYPPEYEYTITGNRRRKPRKGMIGLSSSSSSSPSSSTTVSTHNSSNASVKLGKNIEINKRNITLFRYKEYIYAVDTYCPHNGANLDMGDIEDYALQHFPSSSSSSSSSSLPSPTNTTTSLPPDPVLTSLPSSAFTEPPITSSLGKPPRPISSSFSSTVSSTSSLPCSSSSYIPSSTIAALQYPSLCVVCPRHGFVFNLQSGKSVLPPGTFTLGQYTTRIHQPSSSSSFSSVPTSTISTDPTSSIHVSSELSIVPKGESDVWTDPLTGLMRSSLPSSTDKTDASTTSTTNPTTTLTPNLLTTDTDTLIDTLSKIVYSEHIPRQDIRDMLYPSLATNGSLRLSDVPIEQDEIGHRSTNISSSSSTLPSILQPTASLSRRSSIPLPPILGTKSISPASTGPSTARSSQPSSPHRILSNHSSTTNSTITPTVYTFVPDRRRSIQELVEHITMVKTKEVQQQQQRTIQFPGDGIIEIAMPYLDKKLFGTDLDF